MKFDFIVVGGGSSGCVVANRISANARNMVCLLEAGPDTPPEQVPQSIYSEPFFPDYFDENRYWTRLQAYVDAVGNMSEAEIRSTMRPRRYEQARVMGGGSSVNGQVFIRGMPSDYDEWEGLGADGWSWQACLPYFRRIERDLDFNTPLHGTEGRIPVRRTFPQHWSRFALAFRSGVEEAGIPYIDDSHQQNGEACFPFARNNAYNHRVSAAAGYLDESTRRRPNLKIVANAVVERVIFDGRKAVGVDVRLDGSLQRIEAGEVILCAGALKTPVLLMRSGIGPAAHLADMSIPVICDRPGVGANLLDHPMVGFGVHLRTDGQLADHLASALLMHMRWSSGHPGCSPVDMKLTVNGRFARNALGKRLAMVNFGPNKAYSKGFVRLVSPRPDDEPLVALNYLSDPRDMERLKATTRFVAGLLSNGPASQYLHSFWPGIYGDAVRNFLNPGLVNQVAGAAMARLLDTGSTGGRLFLRLVGDERFSLEKVLSDEMALEEWIRVAVQGDWHPCGTARMGHKDDALSVTAPDGLVIGVDGVRVGDASLMPSIPCANINLTTMMIGERIADHALQTN